MQHRNARTTVYARRLMVQRQLAGWPQARIAEQLGVSRPTVSKWINRYRSEGWAGLEDRSSRPHTTANRTDPAVETQILALRGQEHRGAVYLAGELGLAASTVGRVLHRHHVPALAAIDPITGAEVRRRHSGVRYERPRPGDLLHIDVKSSAGSPTAAAGGCTAAARRSAGAATATTTCTSRSMTTPASPTSKPCPMNATPPAPGSCTAPSPGSVIMVCSCCGSSPTTPRSTGSATTGGRSAWALGIRRRFTKPGCPWTNGKAERLNRTLLTEFAYAKPWLSNHDRLDALDTWVERYNTRRAHSAPGGRPPITRLAA